MRNQGEEHEVIRNIRSTRPVLINLDAFLLSDLARAFFFVVISRQHRYTTRIHARHFPSRLYNSAFFDQRLMHVSALSRNLTPRSSSFVEAASTAGCILILVFIERSSKLFIWSICIRVRHFSYSNSP